MKQYIKVLTDQPVETASDAIRRCKAIEEISKLGRGAFEAMPALINNLTVKVSVDCVLVLRIAAAEAVWKVGGRSDLALPFLAWALKDEYWGVSRKAAQVLGEMGIVAHDAIPHLIQLAERRYQSGPFHFEEFVPLDADESKRGSLLAVVANALGQCGRGATYWKDAHGMLNRLTSCDDEDVRLAAICALEVLEQ